jgi:hypothetical protein
LAGWLIGWLAMWRPEISEVGRDRDFRFFAIDSVDYRGSTIIRKHYKNFKIRPLWVPVL